MVEMMLTEEEVAVEADVAVVMVGDWYISNCMKSSSEVAENIPRAVSMSSRD